MKVGVERIIKNQIWIIWILQIYLNPARTGCLEAIRCTSWTGKFAGKKRCHLHKRACTIEKWGYKGGRTHKLPIRMTTGYNDLPMKHILCTYIFHVHIIFLPILIFTSSSMLFGIHHCITLCYMSANTAKFNGTELPDTSLRYRIFFLNKFILQK